ncbi:MAG TPA: GDSL-type esterase/lipase family protein, partial [Verrucomicrobiae bacterium]|nr:GDSL-type esterase/lipase family protein [Verrucomicrobiae bacterium]
HAKIAFISIAPTRNRWHEVEKQREANNMIERYCQRHGLMFIDVSPVMLGPDGKPKPDIFVADGLHLNAKGYRLWTGVIRPYVH